jgi:hypothetical protein
VWERPAGRPDPNGPGGDAMSRFILLYRGDATPPDAMSPEEGQAEMERWMAWMERCGAAMLDMGAPFGDRASVVDDATSGSPAPLNGYTIVEADSVEGARELTRDHPFLAEGKGDFAIDVFELVDMQAP